MKTLSSSVQNMAAKERQGTIGMKREKIKTVIEKKNEVGVKTNIYFQINKSFLFVFITEARAYRIHFQGYTCVNGHKNHGLIFNIQFPPQKKKNSDMNKFYNRTKKKKEKKDFIRSLIQLIETEFRTVYAWKCSCTQ